MDDLGFLEPVLDLRMTLETELSPPRRQFFAADPWGLWQDVHPFSMAGCTTFFFISLCMSTWQMKQRSGLSFTRRAFFPDSWGL
jgi:hypothetical protein